MVIESKKPSQRALYNQRRREVRRSSEAVRHSMALRDSDTTDMENVEAEHKPESVHDRNRTGIDEVAEADLGDDKDIAESGEGNDDEVPDTN